MWPIRKVVKKEVLEGTVKTRPLFRAISSFLLGELPSLPLFSSVQLLTRVRLFLIPWTAACQASLSITSPQSLPRLMSIESVMPSSHLILCCPLLPPSIFPSIRVFSKESVLHIRWPMYWSFSFNISPSNEHSGLISFRMDRLDLLEVQGTLKSLLQHHSSKASILRHHKPLRLTLLRLGSHPRYLSALSPISYQSPQVLLPLCFIATSAAPVQALSIISLTLYLELISSLQKSYRNKKQCKEHY